MFPYILKSLLKTKGIAIKKSGRGKTASQNFWLKGGGELRLIGIGRRVVVGGVEVAVGGGEFHFNIFINIVGGVV